jgi:hypothetical protein
LTRALRVAVPLAAAATLVLVAGLLVRDRTGVGPAPGEVAYRSQTRPAIESLLAEEQPVDRSDCVLRWSLDEDAEAVEFSVRVLDSDLRLLGTRDRLSEAELRVPPAWLEELAPGSSILWQVDAVTLDGRMIRSETFTTRVR